MAELTFDESWGGTPPQQAEALSEGGLETLQKVTKMVNPERFAELQKSWPESKNVEDRRSMATSMFNEIKQAFKDWKGKPQLLTDFTTHDLRNIIMMK